jgi:hypothetical protein
MPAPDTPELKKRALFIGGGSDGQLSHIDNHTKYIDVAVPSELQVAVAGSLADTEPVTRLERYFLYPEQIVVDGEPISIYIIQGWDMNDVAEYLVMLYIKILDA